MDKDGKLDRTMNRERHMQPLNQMRMAVFSAATAMLACFYLAFVLSGNPANAAQVAIHSVSVSQTALAR